ncbi:VanZ family protein [Eggerthellaceae bacterium zg-887]|uniref:VanZ family protein n=1 Tax=Xiamenia xianingshaonis TaxID=2682776 RepID=UPI00140D75C7|nr:VanZ family protein [Xiamenia xianingshaonis]NHM16579.1 VanZ family protein [Xiamenia xianingshaonis]
MSKATEFFAQRKEAVFWILAVLWMGFIFFMSAHTGSDLDQGTGLFAAIKASLEDFVARTVGLQTDVVSTLAHFAEYLVLGILLANALRLRTSAGKAFLIAVLAGSLYGVTDEIHQIFVPGRLCDPADWLTDTLGCTLGALCLSALKRPQAKK